MVKMVVGIVGVAFRMLLRYWAKDDKVLSANIVDTEQFAQQCGLSIWEAKKFNRTIEDFIDIIAENFIREFGNQIEGKRKEAILHQVQADIEKISISDIRLITAISNPEDLCNLIMEQSKKERESWGDVEIGAYTNCIRYISKAGIEFVSKLPNFTPKALEVIVKRQEEYHQDLYNILMDIHSMTSLIKSMDTTYREYENIYRDKLIEKYSKIELIGSGINNARNVTRYDISSAYVELSCVNEYGYGEEIELSQVFSDNNVVWIKGEAGSGKTTFLQWIAVCAAKNEYQKIEGIRNMVPIVIELRNAKWPINLQDAINRVTLVYGSRCPDGWIFDLLKERGVVLLFDGLDEISQEKRNETYSFIESIVEQYNRIKILMTARNSVNDYIDCESMDYEILPMKIENIKKFIAYWHRAVLRKDAIIKDHEIDRLQFNLKKKIVESQSLKGLARNPLLCAMICALNYVNNEQLPNDKMELYEKCCEMLMDSRDNQRNIDKRIYPNLPRLDYSQKRKILEEISYWMMNGNVSSERKSDVENYIKHLLKDTNILHGNKYTHKIVLKYLIDRSGIIREPEDGIIDFVHKTFMEFLAVKAICRNCAWNVLVREACNVNWKETIIMCFREMGKENVKYVLKHIIQEGEMKGDERYILIASLGVSNAVFIADNTMKEELDAKIREMIPPKQNNLSEIAQAGSYLLPFLMDSPEYSNDEKENCLNLLDRLETDESIPDILSYIAGNGNQDVKMRALDMLSSYQDSTLEEYNTKEQLVNILKDNIREDCMTIYDSMLNIIHSEILSSKDMKVYAKVKSLHIIFGVSKESLYANKMDFLNYFKGCRELFIEGDVKDFVFLRQFKNITDLKICATGNLTEAVQKFASFKNLGSIKKFYIKADRIDYFCGNDLKQMINIEEFEFRCKYDMLELDFEELNNFQYLKRIVIDVERYLMQDLARQVCVWKKNNAKLEVFLGINPYE